MNIVLANKKTEVKINDESINLSGTHLQGYIDCSYQSIAAKLGEAEIDLGGDKVRANWFIEVTIDGKKVVANIYDWKEFMPVKSVTNWHIGGFDGDSVKLVQAIFPNLPVRSYR
jgi:hypothetical protein